MKIKNIKNNNAMVQRANEFARVFGLKLGANDSIAEFIFQIKSSNLSDAEMIIYTYLVLVGRYPTNDEVGLYLKELTLYGFDVCVNSITKSKNFIKFNNKRLEFHLRGISSKTLLVNVTHTLNCSFHSGIQRVIRSFCERFRSQRKNYHFFYYDNDLENLLLANEIKKSEFFSWPKNIVATKQKNQFRGRIKELIGPKVFSTLRKVRNIGKLILALFSINKMIISHKKKWCLHRLIKQQNSHVFYVPLFYKNKLLLPEIISEGDELETYYPILKHLNSYSSLLFYDLIPITNPEFCKITSQFINYLRLLKVTDQVICISEHVKNQLTKVCELVHREKKRKICFSTLYLGANLHSLEEKKEKNKAPADVPLILYVSTIEPRKNQMSVLISSVKLFERGYRFRLRFVGNPGWENNFFLNAISKYKKKGYDVDILYSVTDNQLVSLYKEAKFTTFLSYNEGFGLPIVESVYLGTPCLTSNLGSMKEIAGVLGGCKLVDPYSIKDIEEAMKTLLTSESEYNDLLEEAKKAHWISWEEYSDNLYNISNNIS